MNWLETWRGRRILLVSPHPDDIAYSISGLVARLSTIGAVDLVTVFSQSAWAMPSELRCAGPNIVTTVRAAEDDTFCHRFGLCLHRLGIPDSSLSGYDGDSELTASPEADRRTFVVKNSLNILLSELAPDCVFAPAAIGGHVDHRIVQLALQNMHPCRSEVVYYEDLPYAANYSLDEIATYFSGLSLAPIRTIGIDDVMATKIEAMWDYASQTDESTVDGIVQHARRLASVASGDGAVMTYAERIWG